METQTKEELEASKNDLESNIKVILPKLKDKDGANND